MQIDLAASIIVDSHFPFPHVINLHLILFKVIDDFRLYLAYKYMQSYANLCLLVQRSNLLSVQVLSNE